MLALLKLKKNKQQSKVKPANEKKTTTKQLW